MTSLWLSIQPLARVAPWIVLTAAATVFPLLFFVTAPYGRHFRPGWGPALGSRSGWVAMEWPAVRAAWAFAAFTFANLAPRAVSNHRRYREKFPDYPADRRALVPFIW